MEFEIIESRSNIYSYENNILIDDQVEYELGNAKKVIAKVLAKNKIARNNDQWLILLTWLKTNCIRKTNLNGKDGFFLAIDNIPNLLMPSSITRARRILNYEEGKYLPDDPKVLLRRKIREGKYYEHFAKKLIAMPKNSYQNGGCI